MFGPNKNPDDPQAFSKSPLLPWLRVIAPAAFLGYGLYLVTGSVIVALAVGGGVLLLCRFLLGVSRGEPAEEESRAPR